MKATNVATSRQGDDRMSNSTRVLAAFVALVSLAVSSSQPTVKAHDHGEAIEAMSNFLYSWVINHDEVTTLSYFGESAMGRFAPIMDTGVDGRKTGLEYWPMLTSIWPVNTSLRADHLEDVLAIDPDVYTFVSTELKGAVLYEDVFLVFAVYDDVGINSFDAGYGDVADHLKPTPELPALTMVAGFREPKFPAAGPFVSFWEWTETTPGASRRSGRTRSTDPSGTVRRFNRTARRGGPFSCTELPELGRHHLEVGDGPSGAGQAVRNDQVAVEQPPADQPDDRVAHLPAASNVSRPASTRSAVTSASCGTGPGSSKARCRPSSRVRARSKPPEQRGWCPSFAPPLTPCRPDRRVPLQAFARGWAPERPRAV